MLPAVTCVYTLVFQRLTRFHTSNPHLSTASGIAGRAYAMMCSVCLSRQDANASVDVDDSDYDSDEEDDDEGALFNVHTGTHMIKLDTAMISYQIQI